MKESTVMSLIALAIIVAVAWVVHMPVQQNYIVANGVSISYDYTTSSYFSNGGIVTRAGYTLYNVTDNGKTFPVSLNRVSVVVTNNRTTYTVSGVTINNGNEIYFEYSGTFGGMVIRSTTYTPVVETVTFPENLRDTQEQLRILMTILSILFLFLGATSLSEAYNS